MEFDLDAATVACLRARAQRLTDDTEPCGSPSTVVRAVMGLQAQEEAAALLALRARCRELTQEDASTALIPGRGLIRTWLMRGTLHVVAEEDLQRFLPLLGPRFIEAGHRRLRELGLTEETVSRAVDVIRAVLADGGSVRRADIARLLAARGIPSEGQRTIHLLRRAALQGLVAFGAREGNDETFTWLPHPPPGGDEERGQAGEGGAAGSVEWLQVELLRRYLSAFAPASVADFAAWSGLPRAEARKAWEALGPRYVDVCWPGGSGRLPVSRTAWLEEPVRRPSLRLLGRYDSYLLGYADRKLSVPEEHARLVHPGGGIIRATVLVDGRVVGTWRLVKSARRLVVEVTLLAPLNTDLLTLLEEEVAGLGRFYGTEAGLDVARSL